MIGDFGLIKSQESEYERNRRMVDLKKWDDEFVMKMDADTLCNLIDACHYLNIPDLHNLAARCCGDRISEVNVGFFYSNPKKRVKMVLEEAKSQQPSDHVIDSGN